MMKAASSSDPWMVVPAPRSDRLLRVLEGNGFAGENLAESLTADPRLFSEIQAQTTS